MSELDSLKEQRKVTQICALCAQLLLQNGAESALIDMLSSRLGTTLGMKHVEIAISTNFIVLTTIDCHHNDMTTVRKITESGINMQAVSDIHHIVQAAEQGDLSSDETLNALRQMKPFHYPRWLVAAMTGLACASICRIAEGSISACAMTFIISSLVMYLRQVMASIHIHPLINVYMTAFVAIIGGGLILQILPMTTPAVMLSSSILLLIPGFPLICSISDIFKGYVNTGISRWVVATTLTLAACLGVVTAATILGFKQW